MKYTPEYLKSITKKFSSISEFKKAHYNAYIAINKKRTRDLYLSHMEGFSDTEKLNKTQIRKIASKYKKLIDFREKEPKAVGRAKYLGIYKEITKNMARGPLVKWDLKSLKKEAKKFKRIKDFVKKSKSAYTTMVRLGIKKKVAPHLYRSR